jgi:quercetin dioxygenase-like cupin family protein
VKQQGTSSEPFKISVADVTSRHGEPPWAERLLTDGRNGVVLISDKPGGSNDAHTHPDFNEWWIVMKGQLVWEIGNYPPIHARKGDLVICPAGERHYITTVGNETSLRLGITKPDSDHSVKGDRSSTQEPMPDQEVPPNLLHTSLDSMMAHFGEPPWSSEIVLDDRNRANLICQGPGMSNSGHWHPDFEEWWAILKGGLTWEVGKDRPLIQVQDGDIVFVPKGMRHFITSVGEETTLRLAVTTPKPTHIFTDDDEAAPPPRA